MRSLSLSRITGANKANTAVTARDVLRVYVRLSFNPVSFRGTQSNVVVLGTANVDSEHIYLAMEEHSLRRGGGGSKVRARARWRRLGSDIVPFH